MRKNKTKNVKKRILYFVVFLLILYLLISYIYNRELNIMGINISSTLLGTKEYGIIKEDSNPDYKGKGQEKVDNKDRIFYNFYYYRKE